MTSQRRSILCVDDNYCYRRYIEFVFSDGYDLIFASSGEECIETYREELIDIVLIDSALPDIAATEVCEILKDDPVMTGVPVIFLTEYISSSERVCVYRCGGDDYLSKETSPNELHAVVDIALEELLH